MSLQFTSPFHVLLWNSGAGSLTAFTRGVWSSPVVLLAVDGITVGDLVTFAVVMDGPGAMGAGFARNFPRYVLTLALQRGKPCFMLSGLASVTVLVQETGQIESRTLVADAATYHESISVQHQLVSPTQAGVVDPVTGVVVAGGGYSYSIMPHAPPQAPQAPQAYRQPEQQQLPPSQPQQQQRPQMSYPPPSTTATSTTPWSTMQPMPMPSSAVSPITANTAGAAAAVPHHGLPAASATTYLHQSRQPFHVTQPHPFTSASPTAQGGGSDDDDDGKDHLEAELDLAILRLRAADSGDDGDDDDDGEELGHMARAEEKPAAGSRHEESHGAAGRAGADAGQQQGQEHHAQRRPDEWPVSDAEPVKNERNNVTPPLPPPPPPASWSSLLTSSMANGKDRHEPGAVPKPPAEAPPPGSPPSIAKGKSKRHAMAEKEREQEEELAAQSIALPRRVSPFSFLAWRADLSALVARIPDLGDHLVKLLSIDDVLVADIIQYGVAKDGEPILSCWLATNFRFYVTAVTAAKGKSSGGRVSSFVEGNRTKIVYEDLATGRKGQGQFALRRGNHDAMVMPDRWRARHSAATTTTTTTATATVPRTLSSPCSDESNSRGAKAERTKAPAPSSLPFRLPVPASVAAAAAAAAAQTAVPATVAATAAGKNTNEREGGANGKSPCGQEVSPAHICTTSPFSSITWDAERRLVLVELPPVASRAGPLKLIAIDGVSAKEVVAYGMRKDGEAVFAARLAANFGTYVAAVAAAAKGKPTSYTAGGKAKVEYVDMGSGKAGRGKFNVTAALYQKALGERSGCGSNVDRAATTTTTATTDADEREVRKAGDAKGGSTPLSTPATNGNAAEAEVTSETTEDKASMGEGEPGSHDTRHCDERTPNARAAAVVGGQLAGNLMGGRALGLSCVEMESAFQTAMQRAA